MGLEARAQGLRNYSCEDTGGASTHKGPFPSSHERARLWGLRGSQPVPAQKLLVFDFNSLVVRSLGHLSLRRALGVWSRW